MVRRGEEVPLHREMGRGEAPPLKNLNFHLNGVFWCILSSIFVRALARKKMLIFPPKVVV